MHASFVRLLSISICIGSIIFIAWASIAILPKHFFKAEQPFGGYYSKQARSFLLGRLDVDPSPPTKLLEAKNPYNYRVHTAISSEAKIDIWDHSFYRGKFYLYFGAAPALLLYTPYRAITGTDLRDGAALVFLLSLTLIAFWLILIRFKTLSHITVPWWICGVSLIVLTTSSVWPILLARARTYEVPLASALASTSWGIWFLLTAYHDKGWKISRLALASFSFGVAVASRPHYLLSTSLVLLFMVIILREEWRRRFTILMALTLPSLLIIAGLGVYNYARFDNFVEFGAHYQLGTTDLREVTFFKLSRFFSGLYIVLLHPLLLTEAFPYLSPERPLPKWAGYDRIFVEHPYGYFFIAPWLIVAMYFLLRTLIKKDLYQKEHKQALTAYVIFAAVGLCNLFVSTIWVAIIDRYTAEFAFFLSTLGILILLRTSSVSNRLTRNIIFGMLAFSALYGCATTHILTTQWISERRIP